MLIELLCVAAIYAGAIAYAHWVARRRRRTETNRYVLVADNHESQIEWYMRALQLYGRRSGTDIRISVMLRDSTDETASIVRQMARSDDGIDWLDIAAERSAESDAGVRGFSRGRFAGANGEPGDAESSRAVWVELSKAEDLARLPI